MVGQKCTNKSRYNGSHVLQRDTFLVSVKISIKCVTNNRQQHILIWVTMVIDHGGRLSEGGLCRSSPPLHNFECVVAQHSLHFYCSALISHFFFFFFTIKDFHRALKMTSPRWRHDGDVILGLWQTESEELGGMGVYRKICLSGCIMGDVVTFFFFF